MVIYKAEFPNGKVYIGKTINFELRKYHHIWNSTKNKNTHLLMGKAIRKYGHENIKWEIICECTSIDEMNLKEKEFINKYKSIDSNFGYNMVCGDKEDYVLRENFDEEYRISIIRKKLKSNGHSPEDYIPIDDQIKILLIQDYSNKIGIRSLSKKYKISRQRLRRFFLSQGIQIDQNIAKIKNTFIPSQELIERVINGYKNNKTIKQMSVEEKLTIMMVSRILHDSGIRESTRFRNGRRYDGKQPKKLFS